VDGSEATGNRTKPDVIGATTDSPAQDAANSPHFAKSGARSFRRSTPWLESAMPDWKRLVRERLDTSGLPPCDRDEIVSELAAHLEEIYETARSQYRTEAEAVEIALQEVRDWRALAVEIRCATEEDSMPNRVRSFWLPALANFTLASLLLLALTRISLQPQNLVRPTSGLGPRLYAGWLVTQILSGAFGASLSRRAGGSLCARILSSVFPAIVTIGLWGLVIPVSAMIQHNAYILNHPVYYSLGIIPWVALPGMALLLGAVPFLGGTTLITPNED
jgi:hypothetical protein